MQKSVSIKDRHVRPLEMMFLCALMSVFFGVNLGSLFAFREQLSYLFMLDSYDLDNVLGVFLLGALAGAFLGGFIVSGSGRRIGIILGFVFGAAADCTGVLAPSFSTLLLSEIAAGTGFGIFMVASTVYGCEIASSYMRGRCCCLPAVGCAFGIGFVIICRDLLPTNSGTAVFLIAGSAVMLCCAVIIRFPESPRWLVRAGFNEAALASLIFLRDDQMAAARELALINERDRLPDRDLRLFLHSGIYRSALWLLLIMTFLIHMAGLAFIPYASLDLISRFQQQFLGYFYTYSYHYGYGFIKAAATVGIFGTVSALWLCDRMKRTGLLLGSIIACLVTLILLSGASLFGFSNISTILLSALVLVFIYASMLCLSLFFFVFVPELLPTAGREFGVSVVFITCFAALLAGINELNPVVGYYSLSFFFAFCAGICAFLAVFISRKMPETSAIALEMLETRLFEDKLLSRRSLS